MIATTIRITTLIFGILSTFFFAAIFGNAYIFLAIFLSAWISVVYFDRIIFWLIATIVLFSQFYYDLFFAYFLSFVVFIFVFNFLRKNILRSGYDSGLAEAFLVILMSFCFYLILSIFAQHSFNFSISSIIAIFLSSIVYFILCRFLLRRVERVAALYSANIDLKCHT